MVCFETNGVRRGSGSLRSRSRCRDNRWSMKSVAWANSIKSPTHSRQLHNRRSGIDTLKSNNSSSFRLMECFDTPPKRTIFGTKNSEHWDSFQSKYSSSFDSNQHQFERDEKEIRRRYKLQAWNHDDRIQPPELRRRKQRRHKNWRLLWLVMSCWHSPRSSPRCEMGNELDFQQSNHGEEGFDEARAEKKLRRKKRSSLQERYSDYFERRNDR